MISYYRQLILSNTCWNLQLTTSTKLTLTMSTDFRKTIEEIVNRGNYTDINNLLKGAIKRNKPDIVKLLFKDAKADDVSAALILACENGHIEIVKMLLTRSDIDVNKSACAIDVNKAYNDGCTALMCAIIKGNIEIVQILLDRSDIDVNKSACALSEACEYGYIEIVKMLLDRSDIDVNKADNDGWTPLMRAIFNGNIEIVKMLLTRRDIDVNKADNYWRTALMYACKFGYIEIVKLLLDRSDIDVNKADNAGRTALTILMDLYDTHVVGSDALPLKVSRKIAELLVIYGSKLKKPPGDSFIVSMQVLLANFVFDYKEYYEAQLSSRLLNPPKKRRRTMSKKSPLCLPGTWCQFDTLDVIMTNWNRMKRKMMSLKSKKS